MDNLQLLDLPGARGKVEIENANGIFYKIRLNGDVIKRRKGAWAIPLRNGHTGALRSTGIVPGFQTLRLDGEKVFKMGAHVGTPERIAMWAPLILTAWLPFGVFLGVALFFLGVPAVKNIQMPAGLRIALPLINTFAGAVILTLITGRIGIFAV
jgi:hypothetical protein